eukprot:TRINITY_DN31352_c0_g1_i1.p1 TRINITY_DN31352_c0_g1~~TRINITY_DN31352_c0_g1_i1.p1  ORF type:complete len:526 (+),score=104.36 TRINITY_DN31352_c0_g1_i1:68-1645(+)
MLTDRDLVLEGSREVTKRVKAYVTQGGKPGDVNNMLVEGYEGGPDLCTLLGVWNEGLAKLRGKEAKTGSSVRQCLKTMVGHGAQNAERLKGLDDLVMSAVSPPTWNELLRVDEEWCNILCSLWVEKPDSPALRFFLTGLKRSMAPSSPLPNPILAAAFPSVFQDMLRGILMQSSTDVLLKDEAWVLQTCNLGYHATLLAVLFLENWRKDKATEGTAHKADRLLHAIQKMTVETRPNQLSAAFPFSSKALRTILHEESLCGADAVKIKRETDLTQFKHPVLLLRMVSEALASEKWVDILIDITNADREAVNEVLSAYKKAEKVANENFLLEDVLSDVTHEVVESSKRSGVAALLAVVGFGNVLKTVVESLSDEVSIKVIRLVLKVLLGVVVGNRPALGPLLSERIHEVCLSSHTSDPVTEQAFFYLASAFFIAAASSPSPLPALHLLAVSDLSPQNRTVLHFTLAMIFVYLPPPYSPEAADVVRSLVATPASKEAQRTSLPVLTPFIPKHIRLDPAAFKEFLKSHG